MAFYGFIRIFTDSFYVAIRHFHSVNFGGCKLSFVATIRCTKCIVYTQYTITRTIIIFIRKQNTHLELFRCSNTKQRRSKAPTYDENRNCMFGLWSEKWVDLNSEPNISNPFIVAVATGTVTQDACNKWNIDVVANLVGLECSKQFIYK